MSPFPLSAMPAGFLTPYGVAQVPVVSPLPTLIPRASDGGFAIAASRSGPGPVSSRTTSNGRPVNLDQCRELPYTDGLHP
jgi:hypothetical protein